MPEQNVLSETKDAEFQVVIDARVHAETLSEKDTHWEKAARTKMGRYLTRIEKDFVTSSIDFSECDIVIDVGAEAGKYSMLAIESNVDVVAIDIDLRGLKRLRFKDKRVNTILADARHVPLKNRVFDAAFMIEVLDYIPDLKAALTECSRIIKSEGSVLLSFGNRFSLKSKFRQLYGKSYMHSYHSVAQTLEKLGKIIRREGYGWLPFGRISENKLIPLLAEFERLFGLRKLPRLSPWVLMHVVKTA